MNHSDKYKLIHFHIARTAGKSIRHILEIDHKKHPKHGDYWKDDIEGVHKIRFNFRRTINLGVDIERYSEWNAWDNYKKFTVIRNPFDRMVSLYHYRYKENDLYNNFPGANPFGGDKTLPDGSTLQFKEWIKSPTTKLVKNHEDSFFNQDYYWEQVLQRENPNSPEMTEPIDFVRFVPEWYNQVDLISGRNKNILTDYIIRFENLNEDWDNMFKDLGMETPVLPYGNKFNKTEHKHYSEYYDDETIELVHKLFKKDFDSFGYKFEKREKK